MPITIPLIGRVALSLGLSVTVDDEDLALVEDRRWRAIRSRTSDRFYAASWESRNGKVCTIYMHRLLCGVTDPRQHVDHADHDGLNNCRRNMRLCTRMQNSANTRRTHTGSGFRGVYLIPSTGKFTAHITFQKKARCLGTFADPTEAARTYDTAALRLFGEFATLNFPKAA